MAVSGVLEVILLAANSSKILVGGWTPLLVAGLVLPVMVTWYRAHPIRSRAQRLFLALERNQAGRTEVFHLPRSRAVVMGSELPS